MMSDKNFFPDGSAVAGEDPRDLIDRLVSGDLNEETRRELLGWLDAEPLRWRRCGQAFLEAQAWRNAFHEMARDEVARPVETQTTPPASAAGSRWSRGWTTALSAAALVVMFGLGWTMGQRGGQPVAAITPSEQPAAHVPRDVVPVNHEKKDSIATARPDSVQKPAAGQGNVPVLLTTRPVDCEFTLPIVNQNLPEEHWARQTSVPEYVKSRWGSQGYQVTENHQYIPMELADGRKVVVPVNHVKLKFVGQQSL